MEPDVQNCYRLALDQAPDTAGRLRVLIMVGPDGRVTEVWGHGIGLPVTTVDCVLLRASALQFAKPTGSRAVILVPINFVPRDPPPNR